MKKQKGILYRMVAAIVKWISAGKWHLSENPKRKVE